MGVFMARAGRKRKDVARRRKPGTAKPEATRRPVLVEDRMRDEIEQRMEARPRRQSIREPAPRVAETPLVAISRRDVEERVLRALKTLRALPDKGRRAQAAHGGWPDYVHEAMDAYNSVEERERFQPTPHDISDYLKALSWCRHLPRNEWKLLWFRSFDLSFGLIGDYIGRSDETARRRYEASITEVWYAANNHRA
jgi:hypothetical protein